MDQCLFYQLSARELHKMTDKELRKLSRLELLELLLDASKENKQLKEQLNRLTVENKTARNIENLSVITHQVEKALEYANGITDSLKATSGKEDSVNTGIRERKSPAASGSLSDVEIYRQMLSFFAHNDDKLSVFPADLENSVRGRIRSILERRKQN